MIRGVDPRGSTPFPAFELGNLLRPNIAGFARSAVTLPFRAAQLAAGVVQNLGHVSAMDLVLGIAEGLPAGAYTGAGTERYLRTRARRPRTAATTSATCRPSSTSRRPTSTRASASCSAPPAGTTSRSRPPCARRRRCRWSTTPVTVRDRELVDGGIVSTTNLDIAVNAGAKFIVVVNPLVPYVNDFKTKIRTLTGTRTRHVSDMGFPQIGYQAFKMVAYQRLHEMARQWEQRYPGVDIVLIEPEPDDELMFQTPIMNYTSRVEIARHGFQSVTTQLAFGYPQFLEICKRHGIEISATRVRKVMKHFEAEQGRTRAWRKILEQTTGALLRQLGEDPADPATSARVAGHPGTTRARVARARRCVVSCGDG